MTRAEATDRGGGGGIPSRPRAGRWVRIVAYLLLLGLAVAAIWWIDRGATLTNVGTMPRR